MHFQLARRSMTLDDLELLYVPRNFRPNRGGVRKKWLSAYKCCNISETRQDRTKVTIEVE